MAPQAQPSTHESQQVWTTYIGNADLPEYPFYKWKDLYKNTRLPGKPNNIKTLKQKLKDARNTIREQVQRGSLPSILPVAGTQAPEQPAAAGPSTISAPEAPPAPKRRGKGRAERGGTIPWTHRGMSTRAGGTAARAGANVVNPPIPAPTVEPGPSAGEGSGSVPNNVSTAIAGHGPGGQEPRSASVEAAAEALTQLQSAPVAAPAQPTPPAPAQPAPPAPAQPEPRRSRRLRKKNRTNPSDSDSDADPHHQEAPAAAGLVVAAQYPPPAPAAPTTVVSSPPPASAQPPSVVVRAPLAPRARAVPAPGLAKGPGPSRSSNLATLDSICPTPGPSSEEAARGKPLIYGEKEKQEYNENMARLGAELQRAERQLQRVAAERERQDREEWESEEEMVDEEAEAKAKAKGKGKAKGKTTVNGNGKRPREEEEDEDKERSGKKPKTNGKKHG